MVLCTLTVIISFFVAEETCIDFAHPSREMQKIQNASHGVHNVSVVTCGWFTGFSSETFKNNVRGEINRTKRLRSA